MIYRSVAHSKRIRVLGGQMRDKKLYGNVGVLGDNAF